MEQEIKWTLKSFDDLTARELYDIIWLRNEVFVVEQNCVFQDADYFDQGSMHLYGSGNDGQILAYCRILPPGLVYKEASIGRVVSNPKARGTGAGRELMLKALSLTEDFYGKIPIRIGAQLYLKSFYNSLGFNQTGPVYLLDGIDHIEMLKDG